MAQYTCILDGGPNNSFPVSVDGYWDDKDFIIESVEVIFKNSKTYDLYENLSTKTLEHIAEQVKDQEPWPLGRNLDE